MKLVATASDEVGGDGGRDGFRRGRSVSERCRTRGQAGSVAEHSANSNYTVARLEVNARASGARG
jgi:hypothetical protein